MKRLLNYVGTFRIFYVFYPRLPFICCPPIKHGRSPFSTGDNYAIFGDIREATACYSTAQNANCRGWLSQSTYSVNRLLCVGVNTRVVHCLLSFHECTFYIRVRSVWRSQIFSQQRVNRSNWLAEFPLVFHGFLYSSCWSQFIYTSLFLGSRSQGLRLGWQSFCSSTVEYFDGFGPSVVASNVKRKKLSPSNLCNIDFFGTWTGRSFRERMPSWGNQWMTKNVTACIRNYNVVAKLSGEQSCSTRTFSEAAL